MAAGNDTAAGRWPGAARERRPAVQVKIVWDGIDRPDHAAHTHAGVGVLRGAGAG